MKARREELVWEVAELIYADQNWDKQHVAKQVIALVEAEALRAAAADEESRCEGDWNGTTCDTCSATARRLRERADRIEATQ